MSDADAPSPLDAAAVERAVDAALVDIRGAASLKALKEARLAHTGDKAPLTLANRIIGWAHAGGEGDGG